MFVVMLNTANRVIGRNATRIAWLQVTVRLNEVALIHCWDLTLFIFVVGLKRSSSLRDGASWRYDKRNHTVWPGLVFDILAITRIEGFCLQILL